MAWVCFCVVAVIDCGLALPVDGATLYGCCVVYLLCGLGVWGWLRCFVARLEWLVVSILGGGFAFRCLIGGGLAS